MNMENKLNEEEKEYLKKYALVLGKYLNPEICIYYPIGWRKRPKARTIEAQKAYIQRAKLEKKLGIGLGRWKLNMVGLIENRVETDLENIRYSRIFPINSPSKENLEYLANEALPKEFEGKEFFVFDTMIPCEGDMAWDCA